MLWSFNIEYCIHRPKIKEIILEEERIRNEWIFYLSTWVSQQVRLSHI